MCDMKTCVSMSVDCAHIRTFKKLASGPQTFEDMQRQFDGLPEDVFASSFNKANLSETMKEYIAQAKEIKQPLIVPLQVWSKTLQSTIYVFDLYHLNFHISQACDSQKIGRSIPSYLHHGQTQKARFHNPRLVPGWGECSFPLTVMGSTSFRARVSMILQFVVCIIIMWLLLGKYYCPARQVMGWWIEEHGLSGEVSNASQKEPERFRTEDEKVDATTMATVRYRLRHDLIP